MEWFLSLNFVFLSMQTKQGEKKPLGKEHTSIMCHVGHATGTPAPWLRSVLLWLAVSVRVMHTTPPFLVLILKYFKPCPESLAPSSRCFSVSFHEMQMWSLFSPSSSSFLIETRPQMPYKHWDAGSLQILSFHYQPATFPGWYIPQKPNLCVPPGFLGLQSTSSPPAFVRILGIAGEIVFGSWTVCCICMGSVGEWMRAEHGAHIPAVEIALAVSEHSV